MIKLNTNNNQKIQLIQKGDGNIQASIINDKSENIFNTTISQSDMVMLLNYYQGCKNGSIDSDYIKRDETTGRF